MIQTEWTAATNSATPTTSGERTLKIWILALCLLLLVACGNSQKTGNEIFRYNEADGLASLDPAMASYMSAVRICDYLYDGLLTIDSNGAIASALARSWTVDSSGTLYRFVLRSDAYFHDDPCFNGGIGRKINASDVVYSFQRICNPRTKSAGAWVFRNRIRGFQEYQEQASQPNAVLQGVRAENDSTVVVILEGPFAPFLSLLTMPYCSVLPREAVEKYGVDFSRHAVGSGPFALVRWEMDKNLVLRKHPKYYSYDARGQRLPYLDSVSIGFNRNAKSEFVEYRRGQLDLTLALDPSLHGAVYTENEEITPEFQSHSVMKIVSQSVEYYGILLDSNLEAGKKSALSTNVSLRKALNFAIDRQRIIKHVLRGSALPAHHGVLPPSMPGFSTSTNGYRFNPDSVRRYLAKAGFPNGQGLPPLTIQMGASERTSAVAEAVQQDFKSFGITLNIRQVDFPRHLAMVRAGELSLWRTSWIGDYPDPENFLALFISDNIAPAGPNTTRVHSKRLDSLYREALAPRRSAVQRYSLYNEMEAHIIDVAPWIFLFYPLTHRLAQPSVIGLRPEDGERLPLERISRKKL